MRLILKFKHNKNSLIKRKVTFNIIKAVDFHFFQNSRFVHKFFSYFGHGISRSIILYRYLFSLNLYLSSFNYFNKLIFLNPLTDSSKLLCESFFYIHSYNYYYINNKLNYNNQSLSLFFNEEFLCNSIINLNNNIYMSLNFNKNFIIEFFAIFELAIKIFKLITIYNNIIRLIYFTKLFN
jgi:hypothetical protein